MNILIVDDNEDSRIIIKKTLESGGHTVEVTDNGEEALKVARKSAPDMIISDILMPVMDGFSLCREWKGDERLGGVPFVFYTATYIEPRDEELALSLGADRFIVKPMEPDKFMKIIQGVIRDMAKGKIKAKKPALEKEEEVLKLYSERLVKKLEKKMVDLEREISERRRMQEALQESEENFRTLAEESPISIMTFDPKGYVTFVNKWHIKTFARPKYGTDFFVGKKITELPGLVKAGVIPELEKIFEGKSVMLEDVYFPEFSGGHSGYQSIKAVPIYKEGEFAGGILIKEDVTSRKEAEKAIKEAHKTFLTVLDGIDAHVYVGDMETNEILFMNKRMKESFGSDLTGEICWKALRNEPGPCSYCTNDKLLDKEGEPTGVHVWDDKSPITGRWHIKDSRKNKST